MTNEHRLAKLYGVRGLPFPLFLNEYLNEYDYWYFRALIIEPEIDCHKLLFTIREALGWGL